MDVTLLSYGSRGDVQPSVVLGRALRNVGHQVRLVAPPTFASLAQEYDLPFSPVGVDLQAFLNERIQALAKQGRSIRSLRNLRNELRDVVDTVGHETWEVSQGSELVIGTGPASASVAEKLGVPFVEIAMQPVTPTRAFASPVAPRWFRAGGTANWLSHVAFEQMFWQLFRMNTNRMRSEALGLPPHSLLGPMRKQRLHGLLRLYAYSQHVVPRPDDWPPHHQVTGYWFLPPPDAWQPSAELQAFLAAGPAPVYIGFGSMVGKDPKKMTETVVAALRQSGQRGIFGGGWGGLEGSSVDGDDILFVQDAPHDWLFPRMRAIVHHGGAGTTGAALGSGVPSIVVPFGFDQAFWGQRVVELGVGLSPFPRTRLTTPGLANAIAQVVRDDGMRQRAAQLGALIQQEQGTARALDLIHTALHTTAI